jgi:hypothetical protein
MELRIDTLPLAAGPDNANVGALDDALSLKHSISLNGGGSKSKIKHFSEERADEKLSHFYLCLSVIVPAFITERESVVIVATTE